MLTDDDKLLDDIIYARVLITMQRMQLDEQDGKLRRYLSEMVGTSPESRRACQESLRRAWVRASDSLGIGDPVEERPVAVDYSQGLKAA